MTNHVDILPVTDETSTSGTLGSTRAVVSYVVFRSLGVLLPEAYDEDVEQRWGVGLSVRSPVFTVAVHTSDSGMVENTLDVDVRLRFRLGHVGRRSNPQCVTWVTKAERYVMCGGVTPLYHMK